MVFHSQNCGVSPPALAKHQGLPCARLHGSMATERRPGNGRKMWGNGCQHNRTFSISFFSSPEPQNKTQLGCILTRFHLPQILLWLLLLPYSLGVHDLDAYSSETQLLKCSQKCLYQYSSSMCCLAWKFPCQKKSTTMKHANESVVSIPVPFWLLTCNGHMIVHRSALPFLTCEDTSETSSSLPLGHRTLLSPSLLC